ncbi:MAG: transposase InsO family protein [Bradymonadia bacterium]
MWSRKAVAWAVHDRECTDLASSLLETALMSEGLGTVDLVLHSDNGAPMKGATLRATMERLGVTPSYSRPSVSNDNPFSESLFGTAKGRPQYPRRPFKTQSEAHHWAQTFVAWYHHDHLHSGIGFVTPKQRHDGQSTAILERRRAVYEAARSRKPDRWSGRTRKWNAPAVVHLNPAVDDRIHTMIAEAA